MAYQYPPDPTRLTYDGTNFRNIILENRDDQVAAAFIDMVFASQTGPGANHRAEDERAGKLHSIEIIPPYYREPRWLDTHGYAVGNNNGKPLPIFIISSNVEVSNFVLKRDILVSNCHFTGSVDFLNITGAFSISFNNCTFDKHIRLQDAQIKKLSITNTQGSVKISVTDCKLDELEIKGEKKAKLFVHETKSGLINIDLGFNN